MKILPIIASMILASAMLGYGFAQAQSFGTPTTASNPYTPICGDHPCKPGEVYTPGASANATTTVQANATTTKTNSTATTSGSTPFASQTTVSANVTATKMSNVTSTSTSTGMHVSANVTASKMTNATASMNTNETMSNETMTTQKWVAPDKQVASGTASADVKCPSGFQLALNKFDSRPACVTADVYAKLVARGWAS